MPNDESTNTPPATPSPDKPADWFEPGLKFSCTQCGNCCSGPHGYVWFTDAEAEEMAKFLKIDLHVFLRRHAHTVNGKWTLNERVGPRGYDCVFLQRDDRGLALCSIYSARPKQCRTWPFWPEVVDTQQSWKRAGNTCPGLGNGTFYPADKVRIIRDSNPIDS